MNSLTQSVADYVGQSALLTVQQLLIQLGPVFMLAVMLDRLAQFMRARGARIFGRDVYTYLTAPGVVVHELGHAFFCIIFRHRIVSMQLFRPDRNGRLGSVDHAYNRKSIYQRIGNFFIGTGPIWFGTALLCVVAWFFLGPAARQAVEHVAATNDSPGLQAIASQVAALTWQLLISLARSSVVSTWQFWIFTYLIFCIGSHITLSRADMNGAARGFVSLVAFMLLLNLITLSFGQHFSLRAGQWMLRGSVIFYAAMSLVICLDIGLAAILLVLNSALRVVG
jgi:hypothetical protein